MRTNAPAINRVRTHEGSPAIPRENPEAELRRAVLSCLLFEDTFYERGSEIAQRIRSLAGVVAPEVIRALAVEARTVHGLRHASLFLALTLVGRSPLAAQAIAETIQRPDELSEALAMYWSAGRIKLAASLKRGLSWAFQKFSAERLSKYDRDTAVKLRDVMFLVHPKPKNEEQAAAFKALAERSLAAADTWEVALSGGGNRKETWERLLAEKKLGALALLRNLAGMERAGVPRTLVLDYLRDCNPRGVLPWQVIGAAKAAPWAESALEPLMFRSLEGRKLLGSTILLVDVSGSMQDRLSAKGERTRLDAACALAMIAREMCDGVRVLTFSTALVECPPRRGFGLAEVVVRSQPHGGTYLGRALEAISNAFVDRIIVVTDEQSADAIPEVSASRGYIVNVGPYKPALMVSGKWTRINGWSDRLLDWIAADESRASS